MLGGFAEVSTCEKQILQQRLQFLVAVLCRAYGGCREIAALDAVHHNLLKNINFDPFANKTSGQYGQLEVSYLRNELS